MLGKKSKNVEKFKMKLSKNGADFPVRNFDSINASVFIGKGYLLVWHV